MPNEAHKSGLFRGLRPLNRSGAVRDSVAGVQLAAMSIPQVLGYAAIAGMPSVTGLYTLFLPLVAFAALGSSGYLVVAADSATAAILAGGLSPMATPASPPYVAMAGMVAVITGVFLLLARLLKLGFLADFLSRTVLVGFFTGVGFQVGIGVLAQMLGLQNHSRRAVLQLVAIIRDLPQAHLPTATLAAGVIAGIIVLDRLAPRVPGPLIAVGGAMAASAFWDFAGRGIATVGVISGGLPHLGLARLDVATIEALLPIAASCSLMILAQSAATARVYAVRYREAVDENADLTGLAAANAAAAVSGAFVVNGSPSQTAMLERSGGRSQVSHLTAAAVVALVLLFLTSPFQYLPRCVLGAIVFNVAIHLTDFPRLRRMRAESPGEFWLAVITAVVVVTAGVEQGIVLAMVLSLLRVVSHSYRPHTAVLVQGDDTTWHLTPVSEAKMAVPGLIIYRFGAALFYANAGMFADEMRNLAESSRDLRWIVVDAGAIAEVDYTAARIVRELLEDLKDDRIYVAFAHVQSDLQPDLDRHHLTEAIGRDHIFDTLRHALSAYQLSCDTTR